MFSLLYNIETTDILGVWNSHFLTQVFEFSALLGKTSAIHPTELSSYAEAAAEGNKLPDGSTGHLLS